jgi:HTH-type transcriptional regulator/antitoxin HipB
LAECRISVTGRTVRIRAEGDFGTIARQRRRDLALSQAELAERAGVTRQWVVRFEQGNAEVSLSKAFAVMRELSLTLRADPVDAHNSGVRPPGAIARYAIPTAHVPRLAIGRAPGSSPESPAISRQQRLSEVAEKIKRLDAAYEKADEKPEGRSHD